MGYLDSTTVTVDAVLTKKGRQIISEGGSLDIRYFTLSDTGVDYTLWNADHPSGSAYYGEAIENLPLVEALPNGQYAMRNKLVSLNKDTVQMPSLSVTPQNPIFSIDEAKQFSVQLLGYSAAAGVTGQAGTHLLIPDVNTVYSNTGTQVDVTGNALSFVSEQEIPQARVYELLGTGVQTFSISPVTNLAAQKTITLTFIDILTGAWATSQITVNANITPQGSTVEGGGQG